MYAGEYFVVGMNIEQYDAAEPEKYLKSVLQRESESMVMTAYQSYLGVLPSAPLGFDSFAAQVNRTYVWLN